MVLAPFSLTGPDRTQVLPPMDPVSYGVIGHGR